MFAAKRFDCGGGVHIGQRDHIVRKPQPRKRFPAGFHLGDFGHIGHGTAGIQIGQYHLLGLLFRSFGAPQHIRTLGHEVHAAENDVPGTGFRGNLGELVAVAGKVRETDDFVALIVVAEQDGCGAKLGPRRGNARIHGVIGKRQVVFKAAGIFGVAGICSLRRDRRNVF